MSKRTELRSYAPDVHVVAIFDGSVQLSSRDFGNLADAENYRRTHDDGIHMEQRAKRDAWLRMRNIRRRA